MAITIRTGSALEGNSGLTTATVTITRSNTSEAPDGFYWEVLGSEYNSYYAGSAGFSATADRTDYVASNGSYDTGYTVFAANALEATFTFSISGDNVVEPDETLFVRLYGIPDNQPILGKFTILNDDIVTRFSVSDVSGNEGTAVSGSTALSFVVSRDNADAAGSVTYSFANATTDGSDFVGGLPAGGTVNFAAGVFTQTVTVNVSPDFAIEGNETFQINLGTATGGTILDGQGIGTIVNDDTAGSLIVSNPVVNEAAGTMTFDISRSAGARGDVDFTFQANTFPGAGSATSGADYTSTPQTFQLRNGQTTASYTINILDDGIVEGNETVSLVLTNSTVASFSGGTGTIVDNDVGGAFSVADVTITEGDTGSQSGQFIVTRSAAGGNALGAAAISYTIVDAGSSAQTTATFGSDYTASRSGTLTFAPGQTSATVPFTVIGDTTAEGNETFRLQLASQSTGTIARGVGTATIVDNDGTPPPVAPNTPGLQQGTSGNDVLISTNQGNSILAGGRGDDTYLVYAQGDVVIEAVNEGNDISTPPSATAWARTRSRRCRSPTR